MGDMPEGLNWQDEIELLGEGDKYFCPMLWCPGVKCLWVGSFGRMFQHFRTTDNHQNAIQVIPDYIQQNKIELIWSGYDQNLENVKNYRVIFRWGQKYVYFLAEAKEEITMMQIIYSDGRSVDEEVNKYNCNVKIKSIQPTTSGQAKKQKTEPELPDLNYVIECKFVDTHIILMEEPEFLHTNHMDIDAERALIVDTSILKPYCTNHDLIMDLEFVQIS